MPEDNESENTGLLEMKSLQLEMKVMQQNREEDRHEFLDFSFTVNKNFKTIQENFKTLNANLEKVYNAAKLPPVIGRAHV